MDVAEEIAAKLKKSLPRPVSWAVRLVIWGIAAVIAFALLRGYGTLRLAAHLEACLKQPAPPSTLTLIQAQHLGACLEARSGLLERALLESTNRALKALPNSPPQFIGDWIAARGPMEYKVELRGDGRFTAEPLRNAPPGAQNVTGHWGVDGDRMIWLYDEGHFWPPQINPIKNTLDESFTLVEVDGSTTRYKKL